jgi:hypothetical protein
MPTELENILNVKTAFIDAQQAALEKLLIRLGGQFANDLAQIVGAGVFDLGVLQEALDVLGYSQEIINKLDPFQGLLDYSRQASAAQGVNFLLTSQQEAQLETFLQIAQQRIAVSFRSEIAGSMLDFAIKSKLSQRPTAQIIAEAAEQLEVFGRRASTEVGTALSQFDRAVSSMLYENAEIELFFYFPPTLIQTSRPACIAAVSDPRQQTGWTRADIEAEPDLDFILGGKPYYNCRHEWISFEAAKEGNL